MYDFKVLLAALKAKGIVVAEDAAEEGYKALSQWLKESAAAGVGQGGPLGLLNGVVAMLVPQLDLVVLPQLDKIDGKVGS